MSSSSEMIHVRVDDQIKAQAIETLDAMGLSISEAVRLFLYRVVADQALPFDVRVPNAKTKAAMAEADKIAASRKTRFRKADEIITSLEENSR